MMAGFLAMSSLGFQACGSGGNGSAGGGSFTLSAVAQFPAGASNINFSTTDEALSCAFVCEARLSAGGNEELSKTFNAVLTCLNGQPLGGEVVIFDNEPVNVISFDSPFTLFLECVNLQDTLLDFLGGFGGSVTFEVKPGESMDLGKVPLIEQSLVDIDLCFPGAIDLALTGAIFAFCDFEQEIPEGLFGLCGAADPQALANILKTLLGCPFCGDGELQPEVGEECENDADCGEGEFCFDVGETDGCECESDGTTTDACGDRLCEPGVGENSTNCSEDCFCGDGIKDDAELCDSSDSSSICLPGTVCGSPGTPDACICVSETSGGGS